MVNNAAKNTPMETDNATVIGWPLYTVLVTPVNIATRSALTLIIREDAAPCSAGKMDNELEKTMG